MSPEANRSTSLDMIRWTFSIDPERRQEVSEYLTDLGLEIQVVGDQFIVTWEDPDGEDVSGIIEELWEVHGAPFEVTHEEFHRLSLSVYQPEGEEEAGTRDAVA